MHISAIASSSALMLGPTMAKSSRHSAPRLLQAVGSSRLKGGDPVSAQHQRRHYAMPVNRGSSVDAMLGTSVPPPPREGAQVENVQRHRPNNPNDLSELLNPKNASDPFGERKRGGGRPASGGRYAELQRIKGTAVGAERRGTPIPSRDEMLDEMFKRPFRELEEAKNIVDREHPHPIDAMNGRNEVDERVLAAARALHAAGTAPTTSASVANESSVTSAKLRAANIPQLLRSFEERAGAQLSIELPYESTPSQARRVKLTSASSTEEELEHAKDDGVLLLAYVTNLHGGRGKERISVCSGFAIDGGDRMAADEGDGKGHLVVTCAHTLRIAGLNKSKPEGKDSGDSASKEDSSIALAITRTGAIYPIRTLVSSLATSDLVLLQLGEEPLTLHEHAIPSIRTLPISPYPATVNTELSVSSFWGWEDDSGAVLPAYTYDEQRQKLKAAAPLPPPPGREPEQVKLERDDAGRSRWGRARLVEYKDPCGGQALVGTYDELAQLDYKLLISSPANPPALQGDAAMRMSSTVSASTGPAVIASPAMKREPLPNFPPPGSSGGPVVDVESGSVVGIVRGHKMSPLEGRRGDAIPAEKIFEFFALPGLGKKK